MRLIYREHCVLEVDFTRTKCTSLSRGTQRFPLRLLVDLYHRSRLSRQGSVSHSFEERSKSTVHFENFGEQNINRNSNRHRSEIQKVGSPFDCKIVHENKLKQKELKYSISATETTKTYFFQS